MTCSSAAQVWTGPIPATAGIGLRAPHLHALLDSTPNLGWVEVHSENYFGCGIPLAHLSRVRRDYPVSLHGVGLSIGSTDPLDDSHLCELDRLINNLQPALVSEHLSWGSVGGQHFNDLLPLPYTEEALKHVVTRVQQIQDRLGRKILIENISSYLEFTHSVIPEAEFLATLARRSGCGILLDVNNVYVSAQNHDFDPYGYLDALSAEDIQEIHLAGFTRKHVEGGELLIDTHNQRVFHEVWRLYDAAIAKFGPRPTLIEWDTDLPSLNTLVLEANKAQALLEYHHAHAA
jgi:uncharacterized protein (UPF0276 family)